MLRWTSVKYVLPIALALSSSSSFAGQTDSKTDPCPAIPVSVILPDGRALIHLPPTAFEARVRGHSTAISAFEENLTPKRIVLVLDASRNVNAEAWKIETSLAGYLVDGAPPQASFALVIMNEETPSLDFTTSRETLKSELAGLATARPANTRLNEDIYGRLISALKLFGTRQFGDSMFVFVGGADDSKRTDVYEVQRAFVEQGVRLFGLILGQTAVSSFYKTKPDGSDVPFDPDTDEIGGLAVKTGGLLAVENTRMQWATYHLTDERLKQLETTTHRLYSQIVTPYRLQIAADAATKPENWSIDLSGPIKSKAPGASVLFPHQLATCTPRSSP
jgi:hypothetical protein